MLVQSFLWFVWKNTKINESTGADASVEALKLYHMKLTLAYSIVAYLLC